MNWSFYIVPILMIVISWLIAKHYRQQGYNFWRTFIFSLLMMIGVVAIFWSAIKK